MICVCGANVCVLSQREVRFWFATGGAGFCLSRRLAEKMAPWARYPLASSPLARAAWLISAAANQTSALMVAPSDRCRATPSPSEPSGKGQHGRVSGKTPNSQLLHSPPTAVHEPVHESRPIREPFGCPWLPKSNGNLVVCVSAAPGSSRRRQRSVSLTTARWASSWGSAWAWPWCAPPSSTPTWRTCCSSAPAASRSRWVGLRLLFILLLILLLHRLLFILILLLSSSSLTGCCLSCRSL